jgi:hypothetical protein
VRRGFMAGAAGAPVAAPQAPARRCGGALLGSGGEGEGWGWTGWYRREEIGEEKG